jgi:hypothetical protein
MRIAFKNGYEISIIDAPYPGDISKEIAIFVEGDFATPEEIFGEDPYDQVMIVPSEEIPEIMDRVRAFPAPSRSILAHALKNSTYF